MNILTQIPRKIEQIKSPLQEVSRQLAKIGSPGSYATRLTVAAGDLHLEVQGVGRIRFPITPSTARRLCTVARPARHGFKDETRLDQRVRDTWEIARSKISIDQSRCLPSRFTGGAISIEHHGAKMRVGGSDKSLTFIVFYADCHHEVHPIREGYRIVLTYNLVLEHNATPAGALPTRSTNLWICVIRRFPRRGTSRPCRPISERAPARGRCPPTAAPARP